VATGVLLAATVGVVLTGGKQRESARNGAVEPDKPDPPPTKPQPLAIKSVEVARDQALKVAKPGDPVTPLALTREPEKFTDSWTLETTQPRKGVGVIAYQPNGNLIAVGGADGAVRLYEAKTAKFKKALLTSLPIAGLTWTPDGKHLVALAQSALPKMVVWNLEGGQVVREFDPPLSAARVSPDGRFVAGITPNSGVGVYDLTKLGKPVELGLRDARASAVAWHPASTQLMVGYQDGYVRFWDLAKQKPEVIREFDSGLGGVNCLAWHAERTYAVGGSGYLLRNGDQTAKTPYAAAHTALDYSPDGKYVAISNSQNQYCLVVEVAKPDAKPTQIDDYMFAAWSQDGSELCLLSNRGQCQFVDRTGKRLRPLPEFDHALPYNAQKGFFIPPAKGENPFVFVVQHKDGQKTYTPEEFEKLTSKWKNNPDSLK
jgi:WD40 repeat protein